MKLTRRLFLQITGASTVAWQLQGCGDDDARTEGTDTGTNPEECGFGAQPPTWEDTTTVKYGTTSTTICPYCGCGCGAVVTVADGKVVNLEGDPDHPVNRGSLCSKGAAMSQLSLVNGETNPHRLTTPRYRAPGATEWTDVSWEDAISGITAKVKETRDANWTATDDSDRVVNRTDAIACLGGAALDTEECYLLVKAMRAMGLVYIEHQARI